MWSNPKLKSAYIGNYEIYEYDVYGEGRKYERVLRLEKRNSKGMTTGKVYTFRSWQHAKAAGWKHFGDKK